MPLDLQPVEHQHQQIKFVEPAPEPLAAAWTAFAAANRCETSL
ncbi:MAG: hypothetical protein WA005_02375 [Candidatus Binataceae bacterium]